MTSELQPFQKRVIQEQKDLQQKVSDLFFFVNSKAFPHIGEREQDQLTDQLEVMSKYNDILLERINDFKPN